MIRHFIWVIALVFAGCAPRDDVPDGPVTPLLFNPYDIAEKDTLLILVPGTLTPMGIFDPVVAWADRGYAFAVYRFPGMDGRPLKGVLSLEKATDSIVALAEYYPDKEIKLLGFSTGAAIALMAADRIGPRAQVAALSTAVEYGGGLQTGARSLADVVSAASQAKSFKTASVWNRYFPTLLFGRAGAVDPARADDILRITTQRKKTLVSPSVRLFTSHTSRLIGWRLPPDLKLPPGQAQIFAGADDTVFRPAQTQAFAARIGEVPVTFYPGIGHLSFVAEPAIFDDILRFFEGG